MLSILLVLVLTSLLHEGEKVVEKLLPFDIIRQLVQLKNKIQFLCLKSYCMYLHSVKLMLYQHILYLHME